MWGFKVRIRPADKAFSIYIRTRDGWRCVVCGKQHNEHSRNFGVSHFHGRRKESVRFHPDNAYSMCNLPCHAEWETEKKEGRKFYNFMVERLGRTGFDRLAILANQVGGKDDAMTILRIKEMMKELHPQYKPEDK